MDERVCIAHGSYSRYSIFKLKQHDYAGGGHSDGGGYIEVLEILDPPDGRCGFVIHEFRTNGTATRAYFTEWQTLKDAKESFKECWSYRRDIFSKMKGFIRRVSCGSLDPWFYASGNQELIGDYALPENFQTILLKKILL